MPGTAPLAQLDQAVGLCDVMECQFCGLAHLGFVTHQSRRKLWSTVQAGSIIAQASIRGLPPPADNTRRSRRQGGRRFAVHKGTGNIS